jgi:hypothetical protein
VLVVLWCVSLAWSVHRTGTAPTSAYLSSMTRGWELATGALLALAAPRLAGLRPRSRRALASSGLLLVLVAALSFDATTPFPGWQAAVPVLGTAALLAAGTGTARPHGVAGLLAVRPLPWIGDISYSLYLWHWPVLVLAPAALGGEPSVVETALLVALSFALATASYHLVENPVRRSRRVVGGHRRPLVLWPVALAVVVGATGWSVQRADVALAQRMAAADVALGDTGTTVEERIRDALRRADAGDPLPYPLENLTTLEEDAWHVRYDCRAEDEDTTVEICPVGDADADRTIVLTGDSYAGQWLPVVDEIGDRNGFAVVPLVKHGCLPFDVEQRRFGEPFPECGEFRAWARETIRELEPDAVVLGYRGYWAVEPGEGESVEQAWRDGVRPALADLLEVTPDVTVLASLGPLDEDPAACLTADQSDMGTCTDDQAVKEAEANLVTREVADAMGVRYADVTRLVCADGRCPMVVDRTVTHTDKTHVSVTWALDTRRAFARLTGLRHVA